MRGASRFIRHVEFCLLDPAGLGGGYAFRERFNLAVFVSPCRSYLFVKNEKNASNTLRATFQQLAAGPGAKRVNDTNRWNAPLLQPSDLGLRRISDLNSLVPFKFAVVRNPYTRILSCYLNKFAPSAKKRRTFARRLGGSEDMDFAEFVARVARQKPEEMDPHWRVQTHNIYCRLISFDRLLRFERLGEELPELVARFSGGAGVLDVRKGHTAAELRVAEHYTPAVAGTVREIYAEDFARFGYSTELPA